MADRKGRGRPSQEIDPDKARRILHDGEVRGRPLTEAQRRLFGAAASRKRRKPKKKKEAPVRSTSRSARTEPRRGREGPPRPGPAHAGFWDGLSRAARYGTLKNLFAHTTAELAALAGKGWAALPAEVRRLVTLYGHSRVGRPAKAALDGSSGRGGGYLIQGDLVGGDFDTECPEAGGYLVCRECMGSKNCPGCGGDGGFRGEDCLVCDGSGECQECDGRGLHGDGLPKKGRGRGRPPARSKGGNYVPGAFVTTPDGRARVVRQRGSGPAAAVTVQPENGGPYREYRNDTLRPAKGLGRPGAPPSGSARAKATSSSRMRELQGRFLEEFGVRLYYAEQGGNQIRVDVNHAQERGIPPKMVRDWLEEEGLDILDCEFDHIVVKEPRRPRGAAARPREGGRPWNP